MVYGIHCFLGLQNLMINHNKNDKGKFVTELSQENPLNARTLLLIFLECMLNYVFKKRNIGPVVQVFSMKGTTYARNYSNGCPTVASVCDIF